MYCNEDEILDNFLFNEMVLTNTIGSKQLRTDTRIKHVSGTLGKKGVQQEVIKFKCGVGSMIPAITNSELTAIVDANLTLPPKSTWFEPRIKNGIINMKF